MIDASAIVTCGVVATTAVIHGAKVEIREYAPGSMKLLPHKMSPKSTVPTSRGPFRSRRDERAAAVSVARIDDAGSSRDAARGAQVEMRVVVRPASARPRRSREVSDCARAQLVRIRQTAVGQVDRAPAVHGERRAERREVRVGVQRNDPRRGNRRREPEHRDVAGQEYSIEIRVDDLLDDVATLRHGDIGEIHERRSDLEVRRGSPDDAVRGREHPVLVDVLRAADLGGPGIRLRLEQQRGGVRHGPRVHHGAVDHCTTGRRGRGQRTTHEGEHAQSS